MSQRERIYMMITVAVILIFVGDSFVVQPVMASLKQLSTEKDQLHIDLGKARKAKQEKTHKIARWTGMKANGLTDDPSTAESQILRSIGEWAARSRLNQVSIQTEPSRDKSDLREMNVTASFTGRMESVTDFLYRVESSQVPVRIKQLLIEAKREGSDVVSLNLRLSTVYRGEDERGGSGRG